MFQFLRHLSERVSKARPRQDARGLGAGEGNFLLKVAQNVHRRLRPSDQLPGSLAEFQNTPVFAKYLERHGGFAQQRDMGLAMWLLAQVADQMLQGDNVGAQELLVPTGKWEIVGWILSLQEDPPAVSTNPRMRAFASLCPVGWAATALMSTGRQDVLPGKKPGPMTARRNKRFRRSKEALVCQRPKEGGAPKPSLRPGLHVPLFLSLALPGAMVLRLFQHGLACSTFVWMRKLPEKVLNFPKFKNSDCGVSTLYAPC